MSVPYIDEIISRFNIDTMLIGTQDGTIWYEEENSAYKFNFSSEIIK